MKLATIIRLLQASDAFKQVGDVLQLASLETEPTIALPAAFVVPESESAQPNDLGSNVFEQLITSQFAVAIVVSADGARRGLARESLEQLEAEVLTALAGTAVEGLDRPLVYAGARLLSIGGGRVSRLLSFRAVRRFRVIRNPS
ncbi:MAG: hypothetical protein ACK5SX_16240 [Sandaracinobacter sp.]